MQELIDITSSEFVFFGTSFGALTAYLLEQHLYLLLMKPAAPSRNTFQFCKLSHLCSNLMAV